MFKPFEYLQEEYINTKTITTYEKTIYFETTTVHDALHGMWTDESLLYDRRY